MRANMQTTIAGILLVVAIVVNMPLFAAAGMVAGGYVIKAGDTLALQAMGYVALGSIGLLLAALGFGIGALIARH